MPHRLAVEGRARAARCEVRATNERHKSLFVVARRLIFLTNATLNRFSCSRAGGTAGN